MRLSWVPRKRVQIFLEGKESGLPNRSCSFSTPLRYAQRPRPSSETPLVAYAFLSAVQVRRCLFLPRLRDGAALFDQT
jgi:hypothetical protein